MAGQRGAAATAFGRRLSRGGAARRGTGRGHGDGWKWHGGTTPGSGSPAAKLRHGNATASEGEHGDCGTYPETATGFGQRGARTGLQLRTRVAAGELYAGACGRRVPPTMANGSTTPSDRVTDRWAPRVSDFQISEKLKDPFPHKKNRYKVMKNLEKIMELGNPIWSNFCDYNFLKFSTNFELLQRF
jgi:hypothetical protein